MNIQISNDTAAVRVSAAIANDLLQIPLATCKLIHKLKHHWLL